MPLYMTEYRHGDGPNLSTQVYARDVDHLHEVIALRGGWEVTTGHVFDHMDERPEEEKALASRWDRDPHPVMPSKHILDGRYVEAIHAGTWVGMIAVRGGFIDPVDLLHDNGLLHELAHLAMSPADQYAVPAANRLIVQWRELETRIPGLTRAWATMAVTPIFSKEKHCEHVEIRLWRPGESEDGLWGFDTIADRDKADRGEPAWRRVRPADLPPPSLESQVSRAYLAGTDMKQLVDTVRAEGTVH